MEETEGAGARKRVEGKVAIVTGAGQVDGPGIGTGKAFGFGLLSLARAEG